MKHYENFITQLARVFESVYYKITVVLDLNGRLTEDIPTYKGVGTRVSYFTNTF